MSRARHFDGIAFVALAALAVVLFVSALSWTWVGETFAGVALGFEAVRRARRGRTA